MKFLALADSSVFFWTTKMIYIIYKVCKYLISGQRTNLVDNGNFLQQPNKQTLASHQKLKTLGIN